MKPFEGYVIRAAGDGELISWVHLVPRHPGMFAETLGGVDPDTGVLLMERGYRPGHFHILKAPTQSDFEDLERDPFVVFNRAECTNR